MPSFNDDYSEDKEVFEKKFSQLVNLIEKARHITVFTGAGVSTLSGIPDFRGAHGVYTDPWHGMDVEEIISIDFFRKSPDIFYKWAKDVWYHLEDYTPNIVHKTIALFQEKGLLENVYTQNIDMLHQKAGSKNVFEVHGSPEHHRCFYCGKKFENSYFEIAEKVRRNEVPLCPLCNKPVKPEIIFYGESLNSFVLENAYKDFSNTDLCIVMGSSLTVQPAASFPVIAKRSGADVVIINAQETYEDSIATLLFRDLNQTCSALYTFLLNK